MSETYPVRKNLKIHEETYQMLQDYKRRGETWDLLFRRLSESYEGR
jgi:hypothetical protein